MANLLLEIMKDPFFCIGKSMYAGLSAQVLDNVVNRVVLDIESPEAEQQFLVFKAKTDETEGSPMVKDYVGDADRIVEWEDLEDEDRIVSIVRLNGVMTRGGGACSYGSMDIRNRRGGKRLQHCSNSGLVEKRGGTPFAFPLPAKEQRIKYTPKQVFQRVCSGAS